MKHIKKYDKEWDCHDHDITFNINLDLGNNFSYQNFIDELVKFKDVVKYLCEIDSSLTDGIKITCIGNYGLVTLNTCFSDLADHLRGYY
jgi:hypothetical protein